MSSPAYWEPGHEVLWRYTRPGQVTESVRPMRVVRDDDDALVAWLPAGTPLLRPVLANGRDLRTVPLPERFDLARHGRANRLDRWRGQGILKVAPAGRPWSVWLFWDEGFCFRGWYANLEAPHRRVGPELLTQDHVLDLVVHPDRSVTRKDEDELAVALAHGRFTADEAARIEANATEVEALVADWAAPFRDGWEDWRPDPAWPLPQLPAEYADRASFR